MDNWLAATVNNGLRSAPLIAGDHIIMPRERRDAAVGLRMSSSLKTELEKLAIADDRTLASYIERLLREHVAAVKAESGKPAGKRK